MGSFPPGPSEGRYRQSHDLQAEARNPLQRGSLGVIFAAADTWAQTTARLQEGYWDCINWLTRAGLSAEPDKTELLFFRRRRDPDVGPTHLHLFNPVISSYYTVSAAQHIHYLGFFFSADLTWDKHVKIMCNRARASLKSLPILG